MPVKKKVPHCQKRPPPARFNALLQKYDYNIFGVYIALKNISSRLSLLQNDVKKLSRSFINTVFLNYFF